MTTPPPPQQPPPDAATDAALGVAVASALVSAVNAAAAAALVAHLFARRGIGRGAVLVALDVVMAMPPDAAGFHGPATARIARLNLMRRAQFVVASAKRVQAALRLARSQNVPLWQAIRDAAARERRWYGQHLMASWLRMNAAARVDTEAADHGLLLGWYAVHDARTSAECRAADRHNFRADQMPKIGYPGGVHPHCRCYPGPPFPGAAMVDDATRLVRRAYAAAS